MRTLQKVTIFLAVVLLSACGKNDAGSSPFGRWLIENPVNVEGDTLILTFTEGEMLYQYDGTEDRVTVTGIQADGTVETEGQAVVCGLEKPNVKFTVTSPTTAEMKCLLGFFADAAPYRLRRLPE